MAVKDFAEQRFQENFVNELKRYKWEAPDFLDGNKQKVTVDDLISYWRRQLNRINVDILEGVPLTDNEFKQVMAQVNQISNSYDAARILAAEGSVGKIDGIVRDPNPKVKRRKITLTIFKKAQVRGGDSSYHIAREVETPNGNRFDLILLINGLPLINIELKRTDKSLDQAFGQFKRYYRDGEYSNNFMAFSQMMVISSEIDTRYFATPKSYSSFNPSFVFRWATRENKPVTAYQEVIEKFLMIPMAHQMVGDYLIIDEAKDPENRKHMVMRPYQVHALQAVEGAAAGWDNEEGKPHGGFVWHTTGSGKTVTSFKTALFLSTRLNFDKVIFLVDRRELDSHTSENFKAYAYYESVTVDDTKHTYQLKKLLNSVKAGIVVTTTFKLHNLVTEMLENGDNSLGRKRFVFIVDEAHRTTMGKMMVSIKRYFRKNSFFYGFTGTPLFEENQIKGKINEKSEVIDTTEKLFGPLLHQYTIDEAIADGNVLGFHVDYINTGEFKSHDDLREKLASLEIIQKPNSSRLEVVRKLQQMSDADIERLASSKGLLEYHDKTHIPQVVSAILKNWDIQSQNRVFNAILTVAYKDRVLQYFDEFRRQLDEKQMNLHVAMTFSFNITNDEETDTPIEKIQDMFKHYATFTGIEFLAGDKKHGEDAYFQDVIERFARGGSGRNPKNIDLLIVADQMLTGYDSKFLNTLYVDRSLELHGLIQAYSRTNRVFGKEKEFGTIVNFIYPAITEERVEKALILYGSGGKSSKAIVDTYEKAKEKLAECISDLRSVLPDPVDWITIKDDEEKRKDFFKVFRIASDQMNTVHQYYEFSWESIAHIISQHTWLQFEGAYKNLKVESDEDDVEPPPLIGKTRLVGSQLIDAAFIIKLIGEKVTRKNGIQTVDSETLRIIHEQIQELSNMGDDIQARLLREFVDTELIEGKIPSDISFDKAYADWRHKIREKAIEAFSATWGIDAELLGEVLDKYSLSKPDEIPYGNEIVVNIQKSKASQTKYPTAIELRAGLLANELPAWLNEAKRKYGFDDLEV